MTRLGIKRFENENVKVELHVFNSTCYVSRTNLKEINPITNDYDFKCIKIDNYKEANSIFMDWVIQVNNIKITNILL